MLLHVNGFGGTPLIELYLLYHCASQLLEGRGLKAVRSLVGNYTTSLEMAGASLTVTMLDEETEVAVGRAGAYGRAALVEKNPAHQEGMRGFKSGAGEMNRSPGLLAIDESPQMSPA